LGRTLRARLAHEYGLEINWDIAEFQLARWITAKDRNLLERFVTHYRRAIALDIDDDVVFLARNAFDLDYTGRQNTDVSFSDVKDIYGRSNAG
jgi:peptide chain release factor 3